MRISSPSLTLILTGRGSGMRPVRMGRDVSHGSGRVDRADGGGDRHCRKDDRADGGGGDAGEAIGVEHLSSP